MNYSGLFVGIFADVEVFILQPVVLDVMSGAKVFLPVSSVR